MPIVMPTVEELQHIPPHKRERIRRAILAILADTDQVADHAIHQALDVQAWAEQVRAEARDLERHTDLEPDHITAARRRTLLDNIR